MQTNKVQYFKVFQFKNRLSPPIIISENELYKCCGIIRNVFRELEKLYPYYVQTEPTKFNFAIITPEAAKIVTQRINSEKTKNPQIQLNENLYFEVSKPVSEVKNPQTIPHPVIPEKNTNQEVNPQLNTIQTSSNNTETNTNQEVNKNLNTTQDVSKNTQTFTNEDVKHQLNTIQTSSNNTVNGTNEEVIKMSGGDVNASDSVNKEMNSVDINIPEIEKLIQDAIDHTNLKNYTKMKV